MTSELNNGRRHIRGPATPVPLILGILFKPGYSLLEAVSDLWRRYGDVVRIRVPFNPSTYLIADPDLVGKILMGTEKTNRKARVFDRLKILLGEGLLTSKGELWRTNRRLANPSFHPRMLEKLAEVIEREVKVTSAQWEGRVGSGLQINLTEEITALTFRIICKALFTVDVATKAQGVREAIDSIQNMANSLFFSPPLPLWVPTPFHRKVKRSLKVLDAMCYEMIADHRAHPELYQDLLSTFIAVKDEETGKGLSDRQIRDEVLTLIVAGHETTASSLAMGLEALTREPEIMDRVAAEAATATSFRDLSYTSLVTMEIMRLYPAIWSISRELNEPLEHKGYLFPKDSIVLLLQYITHRHPSYWSEPLRFWPERFAPENSRDRHPFAFFGFGGGARNCVGMPLAKIEMQIVLSHLIKHFRFSSVPDFTYEPQALVTLSARPDILINIAKRGAAKASGN